MRIETSENDFRNKASDKLDRYLRQQPDSSTEELKFGKKIRSNFRHSQTWLSSTYLYPEQPYPVKEYGVTEVTLFPVGGKEVFLQQTSEC